MSGAENMACDEALLMGVTHALDLGEAPAVTLRLYTWEPPAVSLGYHQRAEDLDLERLRAEGVPVVRRPTGGRAIYHARELTYAVAGPLDLFGRGTSVLASYRALSAPILEGFRMAFGVDARLAAKRPEPGPADRSPVACFARPAPCDAVAGGKKIVGSAQVRRRGAFLQHGSIPLAPREKLERSVLLGAGARRIDTLGSLSEAAGHPVSMGDAAEAVIAGFAAVFGVKFVEGELCADEREVMESAVPKTTV
jgi:lipoate-protein ligase A